MKKYGGNGCIDPCFLDLSTSWTWVVSFTPLLLYTCRKITRCTFYRRLGGSQSRPGHFSAVPTVTWKNSYTFTKVHGLVEKLAFLVDLCTEFAPFQWQDLSRKTMYKYSVLGQMDCLSCIKCLASPITRLHTANVRIFVGIPKVFQHPYQDMWTQ
jgi:hypothetical protein